MSLISKVRSISGEELKEKMERGNVQLIDVREPHEFAMGHIKGARNVPLSQIEQLSVVKNSSVYVICQSGMRSKRAYKILNKKGIDVINVTGGMLKWNGAVVKK